MPGNPRPKRHGRIAGRCDSTQNLAGQSLGKEDDAQSLAILLVASAAQTMKEVESNV
jgi:hypothetical protein